ncbi:MAG: hypothetical protein AB8C84_01640 [Oligoflexales bacterium]
MNLPDFSDKSILRFQQFVIFISLGTLVTGIVRSQQSWQDYLRLEESRKILSLTIDELSNETHILEQEIHRLTSSPAYAQKALKDKYHTTSQTEEIIIMQE